MILESRRSAAEGIGYPLQYSWASLVAQLVKNSACDAGDLGLIPGLGRSAGDGNWLPTPVFQSGGFHGLYSPWGRKESDTTEPLSLSCMCVCVCIYIHTHIYVCMYVYIYMYVCMYMQETSM